MAKFLPIRIRNKVMSFIKCRGCGGFMWLHNIYKGHEKVQGGESSYKLWQPAQKLYFGSFTSRNCKGIPDSNFRRIVKHEWRSTPFDFGERTTFDFCFTELWTFSFRTRIKTLYDQVLDLTLVFSITIGIRLFYNFSKWLFNAYNVNKLLILVLFTSSPMFCLTHVITLLVMRHIMLPATTISTPFIHSLRVRTWNL